MGKSFLSFFFVLFLYHILILKQKVQREEFVIGIVRKVQKNATGKVVVLFKTCYVRYF